MQVACESWCLPLSSRTRLQPLHSTLSSPWFSIPLHSTPFASPFLIRQLPYLCLLRHPLLFISLRRLMSPPTSAGFSAALRRSRLPHAASLRRNSTRLPNVPSPIRPPTPSVSLQQRTSACHRTLPLHQYKTRRALWSSVIRPAFRSTSLPDV
jgi:hypothetical protein